MIAKPKENQLKYLKDEKVLRNKSIRAANALTSAGYRYGVVDLANYFTTSELKEALNIATKHKKIKSANFLKRAINRIKVKR